MSPRKPLDGVSVDLLHPSGSNNIVDTRENSLRGFKGTAARSGVKDLSKSHGSMESCDITIPHGDRIDVRVRFEDSFDFHDMRDIRIVIGYGDSETLQTWRAVQAWIVSREAIEEKHEFIFTQMSTWAANGDEKGQSALRAPDLIDINSAGYDEDKSETLQWQIDYHAALGSIYVIVQRGEFVSPQAIALSYEGLYYRDEPCSTHPPESSHDQLRQARDNSVAIGKVMEPMVIRFEWFRRPLGVEGRRAIASEFRNRSESGDQDDESGSKTAGLLNNRTGRSARTQSSEASTQEYGEKESEFKRRKSENARELRTRKMSHELTEDESSQSTAEDDEQEFQPEAHSIKSENDSSTNPKSTRRPEKRVDSARSQARHVPDSSDHDSDEVTQKRRDTRKVPLVKTNGEKDKYTPARQGSDIGSVADAEGRVSESRARLRERLRMELEAAEIRAEALEARSAAKAISRRLFDLDED